MTPPLNVTRPAEVMMGIVCGLGTAAAKVVGPTSPWSSKLIVAAAAVPAIPAVASSANALSVWREAMGILLAAMKDLAVTPAWD
jgi:hypothetical protein